MTDRVHGGPRVWTVWPALRMEVVTCPCDNATREPETVIRQRLAT